jgi:hypothetical protein
MSNKIHNWFRMVVFFLVLGMVFFGFDKEQTYAFDTDCQGTLIPAYFSPQGHPDLWTQAIDTVPAGNIMIMNPSDGPGASLDSGYTGVINRAEAVGITMMGYVMTNYSAIGESSVKADIDKYLSWYGVKSIFIDEVTSEPVGSTLSYYQDLITYVHNNGGTVIINPGTEDTGTEAYLSVGDTTTTDVKRPDQIVIFEDTYANYVGKTFHPWMSNYTANYFVNLVYATPNNDAEVSMSDAITKSKERNAGWIFVTDDNDSNVWNSMPSFWTDEVSQKCSIIPSEPLGLGATAGDSQVTLNWTAPASSGGSTITDYRIKYKLTSESETWTTLGDEVSIGTSGIVSGLENGSSYDFEVQALNLIGWGLYSDVVNATPAIVPSEPLGLGATAGDSQVTLNWTTPASNGGSVITDYIIEKLENSSWTQFADGESTAPTVTVTGLTNGTNYSFRVSAVNVIGTGLTSVSVSATPVAAVTTTPTNTTTPTDTTTPTVTDTVTPTVTSTVTPTVTVTPTITVPDAPTDLTVVRTDGAANLSWAAPVSDGGATITEYQIEYRVALSGGWTLFGFSTTTNTTVTGLTNSVDYEFRVEATNSTGTGLASDVVTATAPNEIDSTEMSLLTDGGIFVASSGTSLADTPKVTVTSDVILELITGDNLSTVNLANGMEITRVDEANFDANQIALTYLDKNTISNLGNGFNPIILVQWGIPEVTLTFSKSVEMHINVGSAWEGQTLTVLRSPSLSSGWTSDGLVSSVCTVTGGVCSFSTNKASYFTLATYQSTSQSSSQENQSNSNSSNGGPSKPVCTDVPPTDNPDLFQIKVNKGKVKLFYTPSSRATAYAVLYGLKKGDERFGAIVSTVNNNNGVQNGDIMALNPKTTYYFKVAAINGCTISPWSEWVPVKSDKTKTVYKYKVIIKKGLKMLINQFLK